MGTKFKSHSHLTSHIKKPLKREMFKGSGVLNTFSVGTTGTGYSARFFSKADFKPELVHGYVKQRDGGFEVLDHYGKADEQEHALLTSNGYKLMGYEI